MIDPCDELHSAAAIQNECPHHTHGMSPNVGPIWVGSIIWMAIWWAPQRGGPIYWKPKPFKMNVLVKHEMFQTLVQYELNSPINHIIHHMADLKSVQLIGVKCRNIPYMMSALLTLNDTCFKKVGSLQNPTSSTLGFKRVSRGSRLMFDLQRWSPVKPSRQAIICHCMSIYWQ